MNQFKWNGCPASDFPTIFDDRRSHRGRGPSAKLSPRATPNLALGEARLSGYPTLLKYRQITHAWSSGNAESPDRATAADISADRAPPLALFLAPLPAAGAARACPPPTCCSSLLLLVRSPPSNRYRVWNLRS
eukprot:1095398-Pelagomonas_calceolata.AAC.3